MTSAPAPLPDYVTAEWLSALKPPELQLDPALPPPECLIRVIRRIVGKDHPMRHDPPGCMSPILGNLIDRMQFQREDWFRALALMLPRLVYTRGTREVEARRERRMVDWAVKEAIPAGLAPAHADLAAALRAVDDLDQWGPHALAACRRVVAELDGAICAWPTSIARAGCACTCDKGSHFTGWEAQDVALATSLSMSTSNPFPMLDELLAMTGEIS